MSSPARLEALERRALAFCLAARLSAWPDDELTSAAGALADGLTPDPEELERPLVHAARTLNRARLEPAYVALFEAGAERCPIHETEYGRMRGLSKGNDLADLSGFYTAFGFTRAEGASAAVMGDHLAVELEFYGALLAKQAAAHERGDAEGEEIVEHARRTFLVDHLGRVAGAVASQPQVRAHADYGPIFGAASELVDDECRQLAVVPTPLELPTSKREPDPEGLCCGGTVAPTPAS